MGGFGEILLKELLNYDILERINRNSLEFFTQMGL